MIVASDRLGELDCDEQAILSFPNGLLGFEEHTRFAVVAADEDGSYSWLQSLDDAALAFLAIVPTIFFPDYEPDVPDADAAELGITDPSHVQLLALVTIGEQSVTANLLGPIVVNLRTRTAKQVVLSEQRYSVKAPLGEG